MKTIIKVILAIALILVGYISYITIRIHFSKPSPIEGITVHSLTTDQQLKGPKDACAIGDRYFVILQNSSIVYEIKNEALIPFVGEHGNGQLQFQSPHIIECNNEFLAVLDIQNRVIQFIDTSGTLLNSIPNRTINERLFPEKKFGENVISNLAISDSLFIYTFGEPGKHATLYKYNLKMKTNTDLKIHVMHVTFLELLPNNHILLYDGLSKELIVYTQAGKKISEIGNSNSRIFKFNEVKDIEADENGNVFILQTDTDDNDKILGYKIDVLSSELKLLTSIKGSNRTIFHLPEVLSVVKNRDLLRVYNSYMDRYYTIDLNHFLQK